MRGERGRVKFTPQENCKFLIVRLISHQERGGKVSAKLVALVVGLIVGLVFYISTRLSSDALGLGLGVFLGVMASLPITLVAIMREREARAELERLKGGTKTGFSIPQQVIPPIIVVPQQIVDKQVNVYRERKPKREIQERQPQQIFPVRRLEEREQQSVEAITAGTTEDEDKPYPKVYR